MNIFWFRWYIDLNILFSNKNYAWISNFNKLISMTNFTAYAAAAGDEADGQRSHDREGKSLL